MVRWPRLRKLYQSGRVSSRRSCHFSPPFHTSMESKFMSNFVGSMASGPVSGS